MRVSKLSAMLLSVTLSVTSLLVPDKTCPEKHQSPSQSDIMGDSGEQGRAADTASISPEPQLLNETLH